MDDSKFNRNIIAEYMGIVKNNDCVDYTLIINDYYVIYNDNIDDVEITDDFLNIGSCKLSWDNVDVVNICMCNAGGL